MRRNRWLWLVVLFAVLVVAFPLAARKGAKVDPGLVGTWQLQWGGRPIYWEIRADGTYSISGPGAGPGHAGGFRAASGKWSLRSPIWKDGGTYNLPDPNTFVGVGKLGPGIWVRAGNSAAVNKVADARPTMSEEDEANYIADYNAQWGRAAQGIRAMMRPARPSSSSSPTIGEDPWRYSSDTQPAGDTYTPEEYQRDVAEANAYWGGNPGAYNRVQNGECTWSDSSNYGC